MTDFVAVPWVACFVVEGMCYLCIKVYLSTLIEFRLGFL